MVQKREWVALTSGSLFLVNAASCISLASYWLVFVSLEDLEKPFWDLLQFGLHFFSFVVMISGSSSSWSLRESDQNPVFLNTIRLCSIGLTITQSSLLMIQAYLAVGIGEGLYIALLTVSVVFSLSLSLYFIDMFNSRLEMMKVAIQLQTITMVFVSGEFLLNCAIHGPLFLSQSHEVMIRGLVFLLLLLNSLIWNFGDLFRTDIGKKESGEKEEVGGEEKKKREEEDEERRLNPIRSRGCLEILHLISLLTSFVSMVGGPPVAFFQLGAASLIGATIQTKREKVSKMTSTGYTTDIFYPLPQGQHRDLSVSF